MKTKTLLSIFIIILANWALPIAAQNIGKKSKDIPEDKKFLSVKMIGVNNEAVYLMRLTIGNYPEERLIEKYSLSDYSKKWSKEVGPDPGLGREHDAKDEGAFYVNGRVLIFRSVYNIKAKSVNMSMHAIDVNGNQKTPIIVSTCPSKPQLSMDMKYSLSFSPDSNFLAIACHYGGTSGKVVSTSEINYVTVLNTKDLSISWKATLPDEYKGMATYSTGFRVDNNGGLVYGFEFTTNSQKTKGGKAVGYLLKDATQPKVTEIELSAGGEYATGLALIEPDGRYTLAGFYKNTNHKADKKFGAYGIYYVTVNYEKGTTTYNHAELFKDNVLEKLDFRGSGSEKDALSWRFKNCNLLAVGGAIYFVGQNVVRDLSGSVYNDLIVSKINNEGKLEWMKSVPSRDETWDEMSFVNNSKDKLYILYAISDKASGFYTGQDYKASDLIPKDSHANKTNLISACVTSDGQRKSKTVSPIQSSSVQAIQLSLTKALMYLYVNEKYQFWEINLD
jgi:hypothetical protein